MSATTPTYGELVDALGPQAKRDMIEFARDAAIDFEIPIHHAAKLTELLYAITFDFPQPERILACTPSYLFDDPFVVERINISPSVISQLKKLIETHPPPAVINDANAIRIDLEFGFSYKQIFHRPPSTTESKAATQETSLDPIPKIRDIEWAYYQLGKSDKDIQTETAPSPGAIFWLTLARGGPQGLSKFADIAAKYLLPKEGLGGKEEFFADDDRTIELAEKLQRIDQPEQGGII